MIRLITGVGCFSFYCYFKIVPFKSLNRSESDSRELGAALLLGRVIEFGTKRERLAVVVEHHWAAVKSLKG